MSIQELLKLPASVRLHSVERNWESLESDEIGLSVEVKKEIDSLLQADKVGKMTWLA